jgi:NAD(P)-dependent dehydrogenase (short-subunit alcohol dehydrogenase family)
MGLGVATSLAQKGWHVHIADLNEDAAKRAASEIRGSYSVTNVAEYQSLHGMFELVFKEHGQINFVFANAGVGERLDFYAPVSDEHIRYPPPELSKVVGVDLNSVVNTSYLAKHYLAKNKTNDISCLVLNASIAGVYPVPFCPIYTAAKHGVVGLARAISPLFFRDYGIRVNALCPGNVRTNLFRADEWDVFDQQEWIEVSQIVKIVELMLFDESLQGKIIEAAPKNHYIVETPAYKDENVRLTLEHPEVTSLGK